MYEERAKSLRWLAFNFPHIDNPQDDSDKMCNCINLYCTQAADALEERDRYALTLQHEMMAEAESHIALVERLNGEIEELQKKVAEWQAQLVKSMCGETLAELENPRWIPVTEDAPSDFVSVQAHMTDAGNFPSIREAYVVDGNWFFPALNEFHPVDVWRRFDEPPKEEAK